MINISTIQGRLTRDPELRHTQAGTSVASFTLANDTGTGEYKKTLFIDCVAWKGTGETISKYCVKGRMLIVSGTLGCREWTDKEGAKRKSYEITVTEFGFCDSKKNDSGNASSNTTNNYTSNTDTQSFAETEDDGELPF